MLLNLNELSQDPTHALNFSFARKEAVDVEGSINAYARMNGVNAGWIEGMMITFEPVVGDESLADGHFFRARFTWSSFYGSVKSGYVRDIYA